MERGITEEEWSWTCNKTEEKGRDRKERSWGKEEAIGRGTKAT